MLVITSSSSCITVEERTEGLNEDIQRQVSEEGGPVVGGADPLWHQGRPLEYFQAVSCELLIVSFCYCIFLLLLFFCFFFDDIFILFTFFYTVAHSIVILPIKTSITLSTTNLFKPFSPPPARCAITTITWF